MQTYAFKIALTPANASPGWAERPSTWTRKRRDPRVAGQIPSSVGSPTMAASARRPRPIQASVPPPPASLSMTLWSATDPRSGTSSARTTASAPAIASRHPLASVAPRPWSQPSWTTAENGSVDHFSLWSTPTTSTWLLSTRLLPPRSSPSMLTRFGRPANDSMRAGARPGSAPGRPGSAPRDRPSAPTRLGSP